MAHPGKNVRLVGLDLHAPAAAISLLPPPQLAVNELKIDRNPGRQPGDHRNEGLAMRLAGSRKADHIDSIVTESQLSVVSCQRSGFKNQTSAATLNPAVNLQSLSFCSLFPNSRSL